MTGDKLPQVCLAKALFLLKGERIRYNFSIPAKDAGLGAPRRCGGHHPMGEAKSGPFRLSFNPQLRVEFRAATVGRSPDRRWRNPEPRNGLVFRGRS